MTLYQHNTSGKIYRVTKTIDTGVYLKYTSYGAYSPRGMSSFATHERLAEHFTLLNNQTNERKHSSPIIQI